MTRFKIERDGGNAERVRLTSIQPLTPGDFREAAKELGVSPSRARKTGFVSARVADARETVTTLWNGPETKIVSEPGDWIVANMDKNRELLRDGDGNANIYVIKPSKFLDLYELDVGATELGRIYRARSVVEAFFLSGGFEIVAPWGDVQRGDSGYLLLSGEDVYGNHKDTFEATYEIIRESA